MMRCGIMAIIRQGKGVVEYGEDGQQVISARGGLLRQLRLRHYAASVTSRSMSSPKGIPHTNYGLRVFPADHRHMQSTEHTNEIADRLISYVLLNKITLV